MDPSTKNRGDHTGIIAQAPAAARRFPYLPAWRVVLCEECGFCLRPGKRALERHLGREHRLRGAELRALVELLESHDVWTPDEPVGFDWRAFARGPLLGGLERGAIGVPAESVDRWRYRGCSSPPFPAVSDDEAAMRAGDGLERRDAGGVGPHSSGLPRRRQYTAPKSADLSAWAAVPMRVETLVLAHGRTNRGLPPKVAFTAQQALSAAALRSSLAVGAADNGWGGCSLDVAIRAASKMDLWVVRLGSGPGWVALAGGHGANEQKSAQMELRRDWPFSAGQNAHAVDRTGGAKVVILMRTTAEAKNHRARLYIDTKLNAPCKRRRGQRTTLTTGPSHVVDYPLRTTPTHEVGRNERDRTREYQEVDVSYPWGEVVDGEASQMGRLGNGCGRWDGGVSSYVWLSGESETETQAGALDAVLAVGRHRTVEAFLAVGTVGALLAVERNWQASLSKRGRNQVGLCSGWGLVEQETCSFSFRLAGRRRWAVRSGGVRPKVGTDERRKQAPHGGRDGAGRATTAAGTATLTLESGGTGPGVVNPRPSVPSCRPNLEFTVTVPAA
ncbi:hypothetical protein PCL_09597 [Purpureocillium lilacinum]|uniref:Uncharacterized protein n=1 Tax=Purpureocillium lilacinum TaxID=33203 RepID=A0A2U3DQI5_PURLI|nr:hypothetical protein PCL_09597 [Purpureocillium lilacinum]